MPHYILIIILNVMVNFILHNVELYTDMPHYILVLLIILTVMTHYEVVFSSYFTIIFY